MHNYIISYHQIKTFLVYANCKMLIFSSLRKAKFLACFFGLAKSVFLSDICIAESSKAIHAALSCAQ